ncbi:MFS transporter [Echinicola marina]|uniref:MFS transporter n=1 Tax=Echinicola marina TaxID=2859768 RepID=UPI0037424566
MIDTSFRKAMLGLDTEGSLSQDLIDQFRVKMGYVDASFKFAYAMGFVLMGYLIDQIKVKRGYGLAMLIWSLAGVFTSFVNSFKGLGTMRFIFGFGESANFPAAIKTIAEWFPKNERSFATGIYNAGANVGIMITVFMVPVLIIHLGWRWSFLLTGLLGIFLLMGWWWIYKSPMENSGIQNEDLKLIKVTDDDSEEHVPWRSLLRKRGTWAIAIGKFMTDPIWWFYLTWLPDFFNSNDALDNKLELTGLALPFIFIYFISDLGSILFGWLSGKMIKRGWSVNKSRKTILLICALLVLPLILAARISNLYLVICLVAIAAAAHQGWSANLLTLSSDIFPKKVVGSVVGLAGMMGAMGGTLFAAFAGLVLVKWGYLPIFVFASVTYLMALILIHILVPDIDKKDTLYK